MSGGKDNQAQLRSSGGKRVALRCPSMIFCGFLEKMSWSCKTEFLEIPKFKKLGVHVTGRPYCSGLSRQEVKIDVWKYL